MVTCCTISKSATSWVVTAKMVSKSSEWRIACTTRFNDCSCSTRWCRAKAACRCSVMSSTTTIPRETSPVSSRTGSDRTRWKRPFSSRSSACSSPARAERYSGSMVVTVSAGRASQIVCPSKLSRERIIRSCPSATR